MTSHQFVIVEGFIEIVMPEPSVSLFILVQWLK